MYSFEFATSLYRTIRKHLQSGLFVPGPEGDEDLGKQVQRLRPGLPPTENSEETGWFDGAEYDRLTEGLLNARRRLYDSLALDGA